MQSSYLTHLIVLILTARILHGFCTSRGVIQSDFGNALPNQKIPFWTGLNSMLSEKYTNMTTDSYAPVIESESKAKAKKQVLP